MLVVDWMPDGGISHGFTSRTCAHAKPTYCCNAVAMVRRDKTPLAPKQNTMYLEAQQRKIKCCNSKKEVMGCKTIVPTDHKIEYDILRIRIYTI